MDELVAAHVQTPLTPPNLGRAGNHAADERRAGAGDGQGPGDRFQSYDEFIMALTAARSQLLVQQSQVDTPKPKPSWWRR